MTNEAIKQTIYQTALRGSPYSDGLPPALASLVVAQAAHETGNFTSPIFKEQNNAFGYSYYEGSNWQLPLPGRVADNNQPTARYATIEDSTREIVDWIDRRRGGAFPQNLATITAPDQYAELLKKAGYYGDTVSNYASGLARYYEFIKPAIPFFGIVAIVLAAWWLTNQRNN